MPEDEALEERLDLPINPQTVQSAQDAPAPLTASAARTARARRRPLARYIGLGFVVVLLVVLAGVAVFSIQKAQRAVPTNLQAYPGSTILSQKKTASSDEIVYASPDLPEKVADFYAKQIGTDDENGCKRIFTTYVKNTDPKGPDIPSLKPGDSYYRCAIDTSMLDQVQIATITISYKAAIQGSEIMVSRNWGSAAR
jgi:hypothetical protein